MAKLKIRRTLTLEQRAYSLATDIVGAIYSAIGNKTVDDQHEGDEMTDVVGQYFQRAGMEEEQTRMSRTRLRINVGVDVSGSMFGTSYGKPIRDASVAAGVLNLALSQVAQQLPVQVFDYSMWIWAAGHRGDGVACLTHPALDYPAAYFDSAFGTQRDVACAEKIFKQLSSGHAPNWRGSSTHMTQLCELLAKWNLEHGAVDAHVLDIMITDGEVYDWRSASEIQAFRQNGRYQALLLNVGRYDTMEVPACFTVFRVDPTVVGPMISEEIFRFVRSTI